MLILTRRRGEAVMIGDGIKVTVCSEGGGSVRLGFDAPPDVTVDREEVYERKKAEIKARPRDRK